MFSLLKKDIKNLGLSTQGIACDFFFPMPQQLGILWLFTLHVLFSCDVGPCYVLLMPITLFTWKWEGVNEKRPLRYRVTRNISADREGINQGWNVNLAPIKASLTNQKQTVRALAEQVSFWKVQWGIKSQVNNHVKQWNLPNSTAAIICLLVAIIGNSLDMPGTWMTKRSRVVLFCQGALVNPLHGQCGERGLLLERTSLWHSWLANRWTWRWYFLLREGLFLGCKSGQNISSALLSPFEATHCP